MPLTSSTLSVLDLEGTALKLWHEFLTGYFDGGSHAVGTSVAQNFPTASILFQQAAPNQPADGISIALAWVNPAAARSCYEPSPVAGQPMRWQHTAWTRFHFFVRASGALPDSANAKWWAARTASLLYALLANVRATRPLAERGIHHLRAGSPQLLSEGHESPGGAAARLYAMRLVTCRAQLRYHSHVL